MSETDRELLELAAKAAGIVGLWHERGQCIHVTNCAGMSDTWWRPHEDDGDALRLAVQLCLFNGAQMFHFRSLERFGNPQLSELECTRRAIVRAAAEIGRAQP